MLSRIYIKRVAREVLGKGPASQFDIQDAIAEKLGRPLTPPEKRKVTQLLKRTFKIVDVRLKDGIKEYYFGRW